MKRKKIKNYLFAAAYFFIAFRLLDFDNPDKLFGAFIVFLAGIYNLLLNKESDFYQRLVRRLWNVIMFLTLFYLIKIFFSL